MKKIKNITARQIQDSRQNPTIEVEVETDKVFTASVPSGASVGKNEALELRDADGGVATAVKNVNEFIAPKLKGKDVLNQKEIDELLIKLDGTENKSKLGANAILAVSMAVCRAAATAKKVPLYQHIAEISNFKFQISNLRIPLAMFNVLEGGEHTDDKHDTAVQEFIVVPQKETFAENLILCNKIFQKLGESLEKNFGKDQIKMGFEGGFAAPVPKTEQALFFLKGAINDDCRVALDVAASQFYGNGRYKIDGRELARSELLEFYEDLINRFPIMSIEDPFSEEDWQGWQSIISKFEIRNPKLLVVGDDLTTTNIKLIKEAHNKSACNGVILKLNQIGTVSETIEAGKLAKSFGWKTVVSHRSAETMDDFIADFSVGIGADFLKAGSPAKPERMAKYQRLMEIEQELVTIK